MGHELADAEGSARAAVHRATESSPVEAPRVRLNPRDRALITGRELSSDVVLIDDPSIEPGGALVELDHGSIDARVTTALARAKAALAEGAQ